MKKSAISILLAVSLAGFTASCGPALAAAETAFVKSSGAAFELNDVPQAGILPTNSFYFVKILGWNIKRALTFSPIKKIELELKIVNQKMAEIGKLSELDLGDDAIVKALKNYEETLTRLKTELHQLKKSSADPEIDKLLGKVANYGLRHQEFLDDLKSKHDKISQSFEEAQAVMNEVVAGLPVKDEPEKSEERMERLIDSILPKLNLFGTREARAAIKEAVEQNLDLVNENAPTALEQAAMTHSQTASASQASRSKEEAVEAFVKYLKEKYPVKPEDIKEPFARVLLIITKASITYVESNLDKVSSKTSEPVPAVVARVKNLLNEAETIFNSGDYFGAWTKTQEAMSVWRALNFRNS